MRSLKKQHAIAGAKISWVKNKNGLSLPFQSRYNFVAFKLSDVFKDFFAENAHLFIDAPQQISGEQNLEYYALYQKYLKLYEDVLSDYISTLDVSVNEFYRELLEVRDDPSIKDKKLLHFVNYLVASTDYESFYKIMGRAAKKARQQQEGVDLDDRAESKSSGGGKREGSKAEGKSSGGDSKNDSK